MLKNANIIYVSPDMFNRDKYNQNKYQSRTPRFGVTFIY